MNYSSAYELSRELYRRIYPACERCEIVGSVKRADPKALTRGVHDIEILLIPDMEELPFNLLGGADQPRFKLDRVILDMKAEGFISDPKYTRKANGERFKKFALVGHEYTDIHGEPADFCLELYIVSAHTWAIQNVIRTGPSAFSQRFVTNESAKCFHRSSGKTYKGLLPDYYQYVEGETTIKVRNTGEILDLKEEEDAIKLLGLRSADNYWIPPEERYMYT